VAAEALIHNLPKLDVEHKQWRRRRLGSYTPWTERVDALDLGCRCSDGEEGVAEHAGVGACGGEGGDRAASEGESLAYLPCSDTSQEG
jgi:hypothetical protein